MSRKQPFLMRFLERDNEPVTSTTVQVVPGSMSNPKEEAPRPEPTRKGPLGD